MEGGCEFADSAERTGAERGTGGNANYLQNYNPLLNQEDFASMGVLGNPMCEGIGSNAAFVQNDNPLFQHNSLFAHSVDGANDLVSYPDFHSPLSMNQFVHQPVQDLKSAPARRKDHQEQTSVKTAEQPEVPEVSWVHGKKSSQEQDLLKNSSAQPTSVDLLRLRLQMDNLAVVSAAQETPFKFGIPPSFQEATAKVSSLPEAEEARTSKHLAFNHFMRLLFWYTPCTFEYLVSLDYAGGIPLEIRELAKDIDGKNTHPRPAGVEDLDFSSKGAPGVAHVINPTSGEDIKTNHWSYLQEQTLTHFRLLLSPHQRIQAASHLLQTLNMDVIKVSNAVHVQVRPQSSPKRRL
ncbi:hypothetical protein CYMTET_52213 [Cymbomonas tetramitiformis]|uniref:Uncharacterized protein n=1 Tax=Cymbomonas tetramitiformis TaxID=36881 RepID=A0AAE0BJK7_9CHLO|nr:hypothetical protein CYMTET_52213 [Cymbomonas tetramitiformis]